MIETHETTVATTTQTNRRRLRRRVGLFPAVDSECFAGYDKATTDDADGPDDAKPSYSSDIDDCVAFLQETRLAYRCRTRFRKTSQMASWDSRSSQKPPITDLLRSDLDHT